MYLTDAVRFYLTPEGTRRMFRERWKGEIKGREGRGGRRKKDAWRLWEVSLHEAIAQLLAHFNFFSYCTAGSLGFWVFSSPSPPFSSSPSLSHPSLTACSLAGLGPQGPPTISSSSSVSLLSSYGLHGNEETRSEAPVLSVGEMGRAGCGLGRPLHGFSSLP